MYSSPVCCLSTGITLPETDAATAAPRDPDAALLAHRLLNRVPFFVDVKLKVIVDTTFAVCF
jgi:hypothetical protein